MLRFCFNFNVAFLTRIITMYSFIRFSFFHMYRERDVHSWITVHTDVSSTFDVLRQEVDREQLQPSTCKGNSKF